MSTHQTVVSELWGKDGEKWSTQSRLPDFSHAGYHEGNDPIPTLPAGVSVKDFGAKGDGTTDDTAAFLKALAEVKGAVEVPAGRYVITNILEINRPGVVLRGVDPEQSILVCPIPLNDIKTNWGATTDGAKTSNYSWSGGMIWFQGEHIQKVLTTIKKESLRGSFTLEVDSSEGLKTGQRIEVHQSDSPDNSLAVHLYSGDEGEAQNLLGSTIARLVCRIRSISGNTVELDRPLRFDIQVGWNPRLLSFEPTVTESGVENIGFEFPEKDYGGHFSELGYNAIAFEKVADCWARNIRMNNADSGVFCEGFFCTVQDVIFNNDRRCDENGSSGHHGVYFGGDDNLFIRFDYRTRFIHDISVSHAAGNVFADGKGLDLCFDHHRRAPYENLFTNLDAGKGSRLWACGGGHALGKHCAARGTFWNIRASNPLSYPPAHFCPESVNVIGLSGTSESETDLLGKWHEVFQGLQLEPENIYFAQLQRRLASKEIP